MNCFYSKSTPETVGMLGLHVELMSSCIWNIVKSSFKRGLRFTISSDINPIYLFSHFWYHMDGRV